MVLARACNTMSLAALGVMSMTQQLPHSVVPSLEVKPQGRT